MDRTVEEDAFASGIAQMLGEVADAVDGCVRPAVTEGAKVARDGWRENARSSFGGTGAYAKSIQYKATGEGSGAHAEIGSATLPGLPHLLEKGHARVGGGRVAGRKHIAPAAEDAFDATERKLSELVAEALGGG